jgi:hypothetical protein
MFCKILISKILSILVLNFSICVLISYGQELKFSTDQIYVVPKKSSDPNHLDHHGKKIKVHKHNEVKSPLLEDLYILDCHKNVDSTIKELQKTNKYLLVEKIPIPQKLYGPSLPNDPNNNPTPDGDHLSSLNLNMGPAWQLLSDASPTIDVAVLDEMIESTHPDVHCAGPNCGTPTIPGLDHGTAVAGIIGAVTNNSIGISGIGYNHIRPVGYVMDIYNVWYAAKNGAKVINCSFMTYPTQVEQEYINEAYYQYGAVIVAAAGNHGYKLNPYSCSEAGVGSGLNYVFPAAYNNVISVTGYYPDKYRQIYAAYNDAVDLCVRMGAYTTLGNPYTGFYYDNASGTSFSAPQVAGAAAVLKILNPSLTNDQIEYLLKLNADPSIYQLVGTGYSNPAETNNNSIYLNTFGISNFRALGYGRCDVGKAALQALSFNSIVPHADLATGIPAFYAISTGSSTPLIKAVSSIPNDAVQWRHNGFGSLVTPDPSKPLEVIYKSAINDREQVVLTLEISDGSPVVGEARVFITISQNTIQYCTAQPVNLHTWDLNIAGSSYDEAKVSWTLLAGPGTLTIQNASASNVLYTPPSNFIGTVVIERKIDWYTTIDGQMCSIAFGIEDWRPKKFVLQFGGPSLTDITGPSTVCPKDKDVLYSVSTANVDNTNFKWSIPAGAIITSGINTNTIKLYFTSEFKGGSLKVDVSDNSGCIATKTLALQMSGSCSPASPDCLLRGVWSTYFGTTGAERVFGVATDPMNGDIVITGGADDYTTLPYTSVLRKYGNLGGRDIYVAKIDPTGTTIKWMTIIGSSDFDVAQRVLVDKSGSIYISGYANATDYYGTKYGPLGGGEDAVCSKLNSDGTVKWSAIIGGTGSDMTEGMALDEGTNSLYLGGQTYSTDLPSASNPYGGWSDGFCVKLSAITGAVRWSAYSGTQGFQDGWGAAFGSDGNPCITGYTNEYFNLTGGTTVGTFGGNWDLYCTKFNRNTGKPIWTSIVGGPGGEEGLDLAVTSTDDIIIVGQTSNQGWDVPWDEISSDDIYLVSLNNSTGNVNYAKAIGGNDHDRAENVFIDVNDNIYITGGTNSTDFISAVQPTNPFTFRSQNSGDVDAFVIKLNNPSNPRTEWATYLGAGPSVTNSTSRQTGMGVTTDNSGNVIVGGSSWGGDFEVFNSPIQTNFKGGINEGFLVKLSQCSLPTIQGPTQLCIGQTNITYTLKPTNPTVTFNWSFPDGVDVVSTKGASITVNTNNYFKGGLVTVYTTDKFNTTSTPVVMELKYMNCCPSVQVDFKTTNYQNPYFASNVCPNSTVVFESQSVNAVNEQWFINGSPLGSGKTATYNFYSAGTYYIELRGFDPQSNCMNVKVKEYVIDYPLNTGPISGSNTYCGTTPQVYTVDLNSNALLYNWFFDASHCVIQSGAGSNAITASLDPSVYGLNVYSQVIDNKGCAGYTSSTFVTNTCAGRVGQLEQEESLEVYPNPFNTETILDLSHFTTNVSVIIYNAKGERVWMRNDVDATSQFSIGSELAAGMYYVQIISKEEVRRIKVVKN